jgi:hypothetical protein
MFWKFAENLPDSLDNHGERVIIIQCWRLRMRLLGQYSLLLTEFVVSDVRLPSPGVAFFAPTVVLAKAGRAPPGRLPPASH